MTAPQQPAGAYVPEGYKLKKKKPIYKRVWFWLLAIIAVIVIVSVATSTGGSDGDGGSASDTVQVVYTIESDAPAISATYSTLNGGNIGQQQNNEVPAPWTQTVEVEDNFVQSFSLIGQMTPVFDGSAPEGTTITCRITVDGEVVAEQTSTGQYAAVTCAAS